MKVPYRLPDGSPCVGGDEQKTKKINIEFEETKPPSVAGKKLIKSGCLWGVFLFLGLISEVMLLYAAFSDELLHWWFIALRWSICCSSVLMIYYASLIKGRVLNGIFTEDLTERVVSFWLPMYTIPSALIILFNPIFQIPLGRNTWRVIDGMASLVFPLLFFLVSRSIIEKNEGLVRGVAHKEARIHANNFTEQNPRIDALEKRLVELETMISYLEEERHHFIRRSDAIKNGVEISIEQLKFENRWDRERYWSHRAIDDHIMKLETMVSFFEEERHRLAREIDKYDQSIGRLNNEVEDLYHKIKMMELRLGKSSPK